MNLHFDWNKRNPRCHVGIENYPCDANESIVLEGNMREKSKLRWKVNGARTIVMLSTDDAFLLSAYLKIPRVARIQLASIIAFQQLPSYSVV